MKDIKELIYAAVEENALKFQELVNAQLQVRAYDAIEALRPEVGASMFGESSHKKMDDEDEEEMEDEDEDEMDDKKKSMKEALHPNQQKIDVVDDEKIDAKDFAKLRQMKKMKEEVEQIDELSKKTTGSYLRKATIDYGRRVRRDALGHAVGGDTDVKNFVKMGDRAQGISRAIKKLTKEEVVNEVAMPKNAADWQALITHQIQKVGHPVATDAQFRATSLGKDKTKIASLEPGEDKTNYAAAQGGTVKQ